MTSARAWAEVDLSAITDNVERLHAMAQVPVMAVVKADGYGHGLVPVAQAAIRGGATWVGVALLDEALTLRAAGIDVRVMSWLTPPGDRFVEAITADIDLSVASVAGVRELARAAQQAGRTARVHIEVDTGMTRGGVLREFDAVVKAFMEEMAAGHLVCAGMWSHFASADQPESASPAHQRERFDAALARARELGLEPEVRHLSNSAATLAHPEARYDLVRCGIAMYGLSPDYTSMGSAAQWGLRPAMKLAARLTLVKDVPAGAEVSYGGTYVMPHDSKVGIIPLGYGDGIPRHGSGVLEVHSEEGAHAIRGRVCMDQFIMECGADSHLVAGDEITLFGGEGPSADQWGMWAGTIGYEIVTRLGPRVERIYRDR